MKRKPFKPTMDTMEPRIALSSWFSDLFGNIFGNSNSTSTTKHLSPQQVQAQKLRIEQARQARQERIAEFRAAHIHH